MARNRITGLESHSCQWRCLLGVDTRVASCEEHNGNLSMLYLENGAKA